MTPAEALGFLPWKLTLPVGPKESPTEVSSAALRAGFEHLPYFRALPDGGVAFRAPVTGVTTSGSNNPRCELREMAVADGKKAAWSSAKGYHRIVVDLAFSRLPTGKDGCGLVGLQIHGADDDITVFRLEKSQLWVTFGDKRKDWRVVDPTYRLGTRVALEYRVWQGKVEALVNGKLVRTIMTSFTGGYFKTGAYSQINAGASPMSADNYGETVIYGITVEHLDKPPATTPTTPVPVPAPQPVPNLGQQRVLIIRHAEKPSGKIQGVTREGKADSHSLTPDGWARAGALVRYFLGSGLTTPTAIYASQGNTASRRPAQTVTPLAEMLGLPVQAKYDAETAADFPRFVAAVKAAPGVVLVALEHSMIPTFVKALGGTLPFEEWPDRWDLTAVLTPTGTGYSVALSAQRLLKGDLPETV